MLRELGHFLWHAPSTLRPKAASSQVDLYETVIDLDKLEPTVACHPDPGQRKKAKEMADVKLDRAYIGSCTGGKTSDFVEFARVIRGHRVAIDTFGDGETVAATGDTEIQFDVDGAGGEYTITIDGKDAGTFTASEAGGA